MLAGRVLVLDTFCEMAPQLAPYADVTYWDLAQIDVPKNSILVVARQTLDRYVATVREIANSQHALVVLVNPTEGSQTMKNQCTRLGIMDLICRHRILLVGCGNMEPEIPCMWYDSYRYKPLSYDENLVECGRAQAIYTQLPKPYKFLFLNGRTRAHRKYAIERLRDLELLSQALWTNLDSSPVPPHANCYGELCERPSEIQLLPPQYEVSRYRDNMQQHQSKFVKNELFDQEWGDIYLNADAYINTYFSLVTETVFDYPYSLRSEKIYKPIAIGHPFVAMANQGFYRDLHHAGFRTFGHLIDESFDSIDNSLDRADRIVQVVADLCTQDLQAFLVAAQDVCVYNQQHMQETAPGIQAEFVPRFQAFLQQYQ